MRYTIDAAQVEFVEGGNTIWVHSPTGATILRIQTKGKIRVKQACINSVAHSDMVVADDIEICIPEGDSDE
jgi:hypothetical protein